MTPTPSTTGPKSIVTSLDWSKKLKEAGWPQDGSTFYWQEHQPTHEFHVWFCDVLHVGEVKVPGLKFAAPSAEEILRRLPVTVKSEEYYLNVRPYGGTDEKWWVGYEDAVSGGQVEGTAQDTLANAAAACYCYLAEQGLLSPKND